MEITNEQLELQMWILTVIDKSIPTHYELKYCYGLWFVSQQLQTQQWYETVRLCPQILIRPCT